MADEPKGGLILPETQTDLLLDAMARLEGIAKQALRDNESLRERLDDHARRIRWIEGRHAVVR